MLPITSRAGLIAHYDTPAWLITALGVSLGVIGLAHLLTHPEPLLVWILEGVLIITPAAIIVYGGYWITTRPLDRADRWIAAGWAVSGAVIAVALATGYVLSEQFSGGLVTESGQLMIFVALGGSLVALLAVVSTQRRYHVPDADYPDANSAGYHDRNQIDDNNDNGTYSWKKERTSGSHMSILSSTMEVYRDKGLYAVGKKIERQLLFGSPISPYLKSFLGKRLHQKVYMYIRLGYWPNIRDPRTFNEKIMHRKLYTDDPLFSIVEDKYRVREYVAGKVGEDLLPDLYHVTDDPETIPFDDLPDEYVIKPTHMSGPIIFVDENERPDPTSIQEECREWLSTTYGSMKEEYWYSHIQPRILVEERLKDDEYGIPPDFKFFVFHGDVEYIEVDMDRHTAHTRRFYDREWNPQEFGLKFPLAPEISEPNQLDTMIEIAEKLGEEFDFVRVDLYQINNSRVIFGEMTVGPESGGGTFMPREYDFEFGSLW